MENGGNPEWPNRMGNEIGGKSNRDVEGGRIRTVPVVPETIIWKPPPIY